MIIGGRYYDTYNILFVRRLKDAGLSRKQIESVIDIMNGICHYCWNADPDCQCWNDE